MIPNSASDWLLRAAILLARISFISKPKTVRYHSLSDSIIQVCEPEFTPAGALSPGMSTSFTLKFKNSANEIIHGFVKFETPNGFFQVPVSAMPPKVDPTLSPKSIDFRRQQTGEKMLRIIELENHGALRGKYEMTLELDDEAEHEDMIEELRYASVHTSMDRLNRPWTVSN